MKVTIEKFEKKIRLKKIIEEFSYEFESGQIYGLYGRNGSGKTMILRAIGGLIRPTKGQIKINDAILGKDFSYPPKMGILIENTQLLKEYSGLRNLKILNSINKEHTVEELKQSLRDVGLDPESKATVKTYSLGMNQKLSLAQAIVGKPEIILLDEPTNGLDELAIESIRTKLISLKEQGSLIILASHNKDDLKFLCDTILKVDCGKITPFEKDEL